MAKKGLPQLPLDVLVCILSHLPPERTRADYSARTIARFSSCSRLFHDAASLPTLWEPHYIARFHHCDVKKEDERAIELNNDWRLMYAARKRLERKALVVVERMIEERKTRRRSTKDLTELSTDVWDILSLEKECPLAPSFLEKSEWGQDHGKVPQRPLCWRYWSTEALSIISRHYAIGELHRVKENEGTSTPVAFDAAMSLLSCFFSIPSDETDAILDYLTDTCEEYVCALGRILDPDHPAYNPAQIAKDICDFLVGNGFGLPHSRDFRELMNNFPHIYLDSCRKTMPLSIVHIFIWVARRLSIEASPVNFPQNVLARVDTEKSPGGFFLVNPCSPHPEDYIMMPPYNFLPQVSEELMEASPTAPMLVRAARNIIASLRDREPPSASASQSAVCCALTIIFLLEPEDRHAFFLLTAAAQLSPIECYTLSVSLSPLLDEVRRAYLEEYCQKGLTQESIEAYTPMDKHHIEESVKYFVGMVFRHRKDEYYGCIIGWDEQYEDSEENRKQVSFSDTRRLANGVNQPFYRVCQFDSNVITYVPQENILVIPLTAELAKTFVTENREMSRYFSDVLIGSRASERGVFRLSPESKLHYPDDDWYGTRWVQEGGEAASEQLAAVEAFTQQFKDLL